MENKVTRRRMRTILDIKSFLSYVYTIDMDKFVLSSRFPLEGDIERISFSRKDDLEFFNDIIEVKDIIVDEIGEVISCNIELVWALETDSL